MSQLCQIRREDRHVAGELVKVGEVCRLPNSLALALEKKGLVYWASPEAHIADAADRHAKRDAKILADMEAAEKKAKKGKSNG